MVRAGIAVSEQIRRKADAQSYGTTAASWFAMSAWPPACENSPLAAPFSVSPNPEELDLNSKFKVSCRLATRWRARVGELRMGNSPSIQLWMDLKPRPREDA